MTNSKMIAPTVALIICPTRPNPPPFIICPAHQTAMATITRKTKRATGPIVVYYMVWLCQSCSQVELGFNLSAKQPMHLEISDRADRALLMKCLCCDWR